MSCVQNQGCSEELCESTLVRAARNTSDSSCSWFFKILLVNAPSGNVYCCQMLCDPHILSLDPGLGSPDIHVAKFVLHIENTIKPLRERLWRLGRTDSGGFLKKHLENITKDWYFWWKPMRCGRHTFSFISWCRYIKYLTISPVSPYYHVWKSHL